MENYRSSRHIIAAANCLINHNHDRMKTGQPIRINAGREKDPPGGAWTHLDPVTFGRVQVLQVADAAFQAEALVEEIERLRGRCGDVAWSDCAVLARTREELAPIRALCESRGVPVRWSPGRKTLPLCRIREVMQLADAAKARHDELLSATGLGGVLKGLTCGQERNPWWDLLAGLLEEWQEETGNSSPSRSFRRIPL